MLLTWWFIYYCLLVVFCLFVWVGVYCYCVCMLLIAVFNYACYFVLMWYWLRLGDFECLFLFCFDLVFLFDVVVVLFVLC